MVKKIVNVKYQCEICGRYWADHDTATTCENSPPPQLKVGDMVIWRGCRDPEYAPFQTLVLDFVTKVDVQYDRTRPGHPPRYTLSKDWSIDGEISEAKTGYVNVAGAIGSPGLHTDQLYAALRSSIKVDNTAELEQVVATLRAAGFPIHERMAHIYANLRKEQYSLTWASTSPKSTRAHYLSPGQQEALRYISLTNLTDNQCLSFIGGSEWSYKDQERLPKPHLVDAFESNRYWDWGAMVAYDLNKAFALLSQKSDKEIIAAVRAYRKAVLVGEAPFHNQKTLQQLFRLNESKAQGRWPRTLLDWLKEQQIKGSGMTRLRRVYDAATDVKNAESESISMKNYLRLWEDKTVIAVLAGKGGVGKSSVAAGLATALARKGKSTLLFDADIYGPSVPYFFPVDNPRYRTKDQRIIPHEVNGVMTVSAGYFLDQDEAIKWRGPYLPPFLHMIGSNLYDDDVEIIICDLPPGTGDVQRAISEFCPHVKYIVVATAGEIAMADVRRLMKMLPGRERAKVIGLVENMAYLSWIDGDEPICPWGSPYDVVNLATEFYYPFLGKIPMTLNNQSEPRIQAIVDTVLPAVERALEGRMYLEVDPIVVTQRANYMINRYGSKTGRKSHLGTMKIHQVWTLDNLAGWLAGAITEHGGDPLDQRYRDVLLRELRRLWIAIGNTPPKIIPNDVWWAETAEEFIATDALEPAKEKDHVC